MSDYLGYVEREKEGLHTRLRKDPHVEPLGTALNSRVNVGKTITFFMTEISHLQNRNKMQTGH